MPSGRTNNFPWKWAWPRSRDRTIFCIQSNISPKLLELETSNLVGGFVLRMPSRRTNNFPENGHGLGHVTPTIFLAVRSTILATAWLLVWLSGTFSLMQKQFSLYASSKGCRGSYSVLDHLSISWWLRVPFCASTITWKVAVGMRCWKSLIWAHRPDPWSRFAMNYGLLVWQL